VIEDFSGIPGSMVQSSSGASYICNVELSKVPYMVVVECQLIDPLITTEADKANQNL